ncbi:hypothetical protein MMC24_002917 [Lignoscripta atroalba]|nr:hypothetical protein [Lignoscripta atroalba]
MASNYSSTQTYTTTSPDSQIHLYGAQQLSPVNSVSATPANASPTSPRSSNILPSLPLATRQLRPPKSPMYIPAVLRPTERPPRPSPLTPPRSVEGSVASLDGLDNGKPPSRRSTGDGKNKESVERHTDGGPTIDLDMEEVTGLPTREHWKPDAIATICDAPVCQKGFSLFERRHHCRHCGHVFCNNHSHYTVPLNEKAEFHPAGAESRACKHCRDQYRQWQATRRSRKNSISSETTTIPGTPTVGIGGGPRSAKSSDGPKSPIASSIPRDWNWSTF